MFMDFREDWPPPSWEPAPRQPRLSERGQAVMGGLVGLNLLLVLVAPLAGSSVIAPLVYYVMGR
jgi:hypothetical protein